MGQKQAERQPLEAGPTVPGKTLQPFIPNWKPNSVQKQFLKRLERQALREGQSWAEARRSRLAFTKIMAEEAMWGTPREREIRRAVYADTRAVSYLKLLANLPGEEPAMIIRISMWAYAREQHPALEDNLRELLIPRDQVLSFFRQRGNQGTSHSELVNKWPHYSTAMCDLRDLGFQFQSARMRNGGDEDFRYVLAKDVGSHRLVSRHEAYAQIARSIESLGKPALLREAWRHAGIAARSGRYYERYLRTSPLNLRWKRLVEDDIVRVSGKHLKRVTYLMAVAQKAVWHSDRNVEDLRTVLFEKLNKRAQRSAKT